MINEGSRQANERMPPGFIHRCIPLKSLLLSLFGFFSIQQLLLWRFLNFAPAWLYVLAAGAFIGAAYVLTRWGQPSQAAPRVSLGLIAGSTIIAFILCLVGGEGGFFYESLDWQVRNAQLRDLVVFPWPYVYAVDGAGDLLHRTQIGLFLIPALVGKVIGLRAAEIGLLIQDALLFGVILSCALALFASPRARLVALIVIVIFSGMDFLGQELRFWREPSFGRAGEGISIESWAATGAGIYPSHINQILWAPHHTVAGWLGAVLFLLWQRRILPLGSFLVFLPLFPLWSPLAVVGLLPLALWAGLRTFWRRELEWADFLAPMLVTVISVPSLLYLAAGGAAMRHTFFNLNAPTYVIFVAFEVAPYAAAAALMIRRSIFGMAPLLIVSAALLLIPAYQVGLGRDFQMRSSIPALFILSILCAEMLLRFAASQRWKEKAAAFALMGILALGSITGAYEMSKAFLLQPSPRVRCSLLNAWDWLEIPTPREQLRFYVAPIQSLPRWLRPSSPARVYRVRERCWEGPWQEPH